MFKGRQSRNRLDKVGILSVQNFVLLNNECLTWHSTGSEYVSMSSKTTPSSLELFPFIKQLAGLIKENLDILVFRPYHNPTGFRKHVPSQLPA